MKTLTTVISALTLSVALTGAANAEKLEAVDQSTYTQLCMTASQGNLPAMHNAIKASGLSKKFVTEKVTCNDQSITEFVAKHGRSADAMNRMLHNSVDEGSVSVTTIAAR